MPKTKAKPFHYSTVGAGPHDGLIENCDRCISRAAWAAQHEQHLLDYDVSEVSVLEQMKRTLIQKHDWEAEDFDGMGFLDIEAEFLEVEEDFRPHED